MTDFLIIVVLGCVTFMGVLAYLFISAPEGYQDGTGFHRGPRRSDDE